MILQALEATGSTLLVGLALACLATILIVLLALIVRATVRRADARERREVERERERCDRQMLEAGLRRSEMHSYNARPTSAERWGGLV